MKSLNLLPLFLALTIAISCFAPAIAETEGERNWENARRIQDIMHSGHVRDREGFLEFWGDLLSTGFGIVLGIIGFFVILFILIYIYTAVTRFFHDFFTKAGRAERKERIERKEFYRDSIAFYDNQEKENLKREFREHQNKIKNKEEGKRTYHLCEQYMKLAKYYVEGKGVDKDLEKAAEYFDVAIEYANQLFSEKTKDRKIKEFSARKKELLAKGR